MGSVFGQLAKKIFVYGVVVNMLVPYGLVNNWKGVSLVEKANASTKVFSTMVDWSAGEYNQTESSSSFDNIRLKADGSWEPREIKAAEWGLGSPGSYISDGSYIYVLRGGGDNEFYSYMPENDEWRNLAQTPYSVSFGDMEIVNGEIYVLFGNNQDVFYKYTIATDSWTKLTSFPELVGQAQLTTDGSYIYATRANTELYKYSIAHDTWAAMKNFTYANASGTLVYNDGYLYHLYNTSGAVHIWYRYRISDGTMTRMADAPGTMSEYNPNWTVASGYLYATRNGSTRNFYRYNFTTDIWETLLDTPILVSNGGVVYNAADNLFYVFRGSGTTDIWRYNSASNSYLGAADTVIAGVATTIGRGSDTFYYNNKLYTLRGINTRTLYGYDISTGVWSQLADIPATKQTAYQYTRGAVANGEIYFVGGSAATTQFMKYTISNNTWTALADAPVAISESALVYPGSGDYIYGTRGSSTSVVWRYSISGNTWDDAGMPDLPINVITGNGASFVSDGTDLYLMLGLGVSNFMKYTKSSGTWSSLARMPFAPIYGSDMVYAGNNKILAIAGNYDKELWEYNITTNSWRRLADMSTQAAAGWGVFEGAAIETDGSGNVFVIRGASTQYVLKYTQSANNYVAAGNWTSAVMDLGYVSNWGSLVASQVKPESSAIVYKTRTSTDKLVWSSWQATDGTVIQSPVARYLQVMVSMSSTVDRTQTPLVNEITINYTGDELAPINPNQISGRSTEVGGITLSSGKTYSFINPYFVWSGASDAQTAVDGYYVYFGTDQNANPVDLGTWQTTTNYTVTEPLTVGSYYLLIKTKDTAKNIANTWEAFNYVYSGIPAEKSLKISLTSEFASGSATNINIANDELKLSSKTAGMWLQERLSIVPFGITYGSRTIAYVKNTNKLYILQGSNNTVFYEYDIANDTWTALAPSSIPIYIGGGIIEGPEGYLYALAGNNSGSFLRYSIVDNSWTSVADAPNTVYYGSSMVYDGSRFIYVTRGNADDSFWVYDTMTDNWTSLANMDFGATDRGPHNLVYDGGDLTFDGNGTIYAIQGYSQPGFASYSINTNSWTVLPDLPTISGAGSSIYYDGTTNAIYYSSGVGTPDFFKFDLNSQTWMALKDAPAGINYGSDIRKVGESLIVTQGGSSQLIWKYDIATNDWQVPTRGVFGKNFYGTTYDSPSYGGAIIKGNADYFYLTRGGYASNFARYNKTTGEVVALSPLPSGSMYG